MIISCDPTINPAPGDVRCREDEMRRQPIPDSIVRTLGEDELVVLDFDHTLLACNSTELFIAVCKPSFLAALIDFVVRGLFPWKLTRLRHWYRLRDYVCCSLIVMLSPWNVLRWKRQGPMLFNRYASKAVADALAGCDPARIVIASFGMRWIIEALIGASEWRKATVLATPNVVGAGYFARGKLDIVRTHLSEREIASATCVTDSLDDQDVLQAVRNGILIKPQGSGFRAAEQLYLPFRYTASAKYPRSYTLDQFLFVDVLLVIAASAHDLSSLWRACLVVPPLMLSLMCVYELGYFENDMKAALKEANPTLSPQVDRFRGYPIKVGAWGCAMVLGAVGICLGWSLGLLRTDLLWPSAIGWAGALIALRAVFSFYNSLPTGSRVFVYPVLQFMKYGVPFVVLPPTIAGALLVISQISQMWCRYMFYRAGGDPKAFDRDLLRLGFFLLGTACVGLSVDTIPRDPFPYLVATGWVCARAMKGPIMWRISRDRASLAASADAA